MCRFAAYLGHPLLMSQLVTQPAHSLIHQSYDSRERREPLNGDGFGVAWFVPEVSPTPAIFKDITPAWNNENLRELARVTTSRCIFAHIRAASPQSPVHRLNCHPFSFQNLAFMHNGFMGGFRQWRRRLTEGLSDQAFEMIRGSTDSEHAFAVLCDIYLSLSSLGPKERLVAAVLGTIERLEALKKEAGLSECSYFNFAVSDGEVMAATRYSSYADESTASLHYTVGSQLRCESGQFLLDPGADPDFALIASEETTPGFDWKVVPINHIVVAEHPGQVELRPIP